MRDTIMSEQYFKDFIAEEEARLQQFTDKLANGEIRADRVFSVEQRVHSIKFGLWIAKYSCGTDMASLKAMFDEILEEFPRFWTKTSSYVNLVWVMSIAVMLEADNEKFSKLAALLDQFDRHDALLDFFCDYKQNGAATLKNRCFSCPVPYQALGEVIEDEANRPSLLRTYLEKKWYSGHKKFGLCDVHKAKEKLYSGYWSFESGALAKILYIDDRILREVPYYPNDLVHYTGLGNGPH